VKRRRVQKLTDNAKELEKLEEKKSRRIFLFPVSVPRDIVTNKKLALRHGHRSRKCSAREMCHIPQGISWSITYDSSSV
jgi:hypothetical protein